MRRLALALLVAAPLAIAAQTADSLAADDPFAHLEALLDEPVQTAATYVQSVGEAPASVTVITADEIDRAGYRTLADVLATVRGFYISDDRNYAYAGVRGLSRPSDFNNRIAVLVDGVPAQDRVTGAGLIGAALGVPLSAVERVEVVRGPGSTLYGTGAMFAVVNVILKDTRTLAGVQGVASAGAYGEFRGEAVAATSLPKGLDVSVAVHGFDDAGSDAYFPEFDTPATSGGVATGLDWERSRGALAAVSAGPVRLDVRVNERDKGIPTGSYESAFGLDAWTRDRLAVGALRVETDLSPRLSVFGMGTLSHYYYYGVYPYDDGDGSGPYDVFDDQNSSTARAEGRLRWDAGPTHRVVVGGEVVSDFQSRYRGYYEGDEFYVSLDDPYRSGALYGQIESQLTAGLALTAGARLDAVRDRVALSPRGALVVTPDERTSLKLLAGSAFRAPSTYELAYEDPFMGQIAAPDLGPERVATFEALASRRVAGAIRVEGAAFYTRVTDLIDVVETGGVAQFANAGRAAAWGAEAAASATLSGWRSRASYGLQNTRDLDTGVTLTNAPTHVAKLTAFGPIGRDLWFSVSGRAESGRKTVYETVTDAYAVLDASLTADLLDEAARLTLGVRNAFDTAYALPGGFEHVQAAIPQRPRTAYLRLDVRL